MLNPPPVVDNCTTANRLRQYAFFTDNINLYKLAYANLSPVLWFILYTKGLLLKINSINLLIIAYAMDRVYIGIWSKNIYSMKAYS